MITEEQAFKIAYKIGVITANEYIFESRKNNRDEPCRVYSMEQFVSRKLSLAQDVSGVGSRRDVTEENRLRT